MIIKRRALGCHVAKGVNPCKLPPRRQRFANKRIRHLSMKRVPWWMSGNFLDFLDLLSSWSSRFQFCISFFFLVTLTKPFCAASLLHNILIWEPFINFLRRLLFVKLWRFRSMAFVEAAEKNRDGLYQRTLGSGRFVALLSSRRSGEIIVHSSLRGDKMRNRSNTV